jgi:hypothetical protein
MNPKHAICIIGISLFAITVRAGPTGQVQSVVFKTTAPPPAFVVPKELKSYEALFRAGLSSLPESMLVNGALALGGQTLGLTPQESTNLNSLLTTTYSRIAADTALRKLPSALPYCLAARRNTNGHYFVYVPEQAGEQSPVIVFLHGFGGNFQFYLWALRESLPEAIIVCPSWNESWYGGRAGGFCHLPSGGEIVSRFHLPGGARNIEHQPIGEENPHFDDQRQSGSDGAD